jgi:hypothetical protein
MHSIKDEFILVYNISVLFFFILFHFLTFTLSSEKKPVHPPRINSHNHATTHRTAITAMPSPTNSSHPLLTNPNTPRQRPVQHHAVEQPHNNQGTPTENSEQQTHTTTTTTKPAIPQVVFPSPYH